MEWRTDKGVIREEMLKYGRHDQLMSYPVTAMAALRTFQTADPHSLSRKSPLLIQLKLIEQYVFRGWLI
jgi:hypothetical protein